MPLSLFNLFGKSQDIFWSLVFARSLKSCGKRFRVKAFTTRIWSPENIVIGSNFTSMGNLYLYGNDGQISIGDNCSINTNIVVGSSCGTISIGNNVMIGPNVVIRAANHCYKDPTKLIRDQGHLGGSIIIGDDVWISSNCVICANVIIGEGAVLAAGSVVVKSVAPYTLVGGVPSVEIGLRSLDRPDSNGQK